MSGVVVTGSGGAAGVAVIRALAAAGECVIAVDADPLAAGLYLADHSAVVAPATEEPFVPQLCETVKRFDADAIVCTVSEEMEPLALHEKELAEAGAAVWLSPPPVVRACIDKWRFAEVATKAGLPVPSTARGGAYDVPGPWVVKPRFGRGSRDVHMVDDARELASICARVREPLVQQRVKGREFTVDVLVDRDGMLAGAVPRWRLEAKAGISTKGRTFADDRVRDVVHGIARGLGLRGVANVQGFVTADGDVLLIEVNPRFSGGLSLSLAAGADLVGEFLRGTRGLPIRPSRLRFDLGVAMTRHYTETFLR